MLCARPEKKLSKDLPGGLGRESTVQFRYVRCALHDNAAEASSWEHVGRGLPKVGLQSTEHRV